jgi:hypothetical protein
MRPFGWDHDHPLGLGLLSPPARRPRRKSDKEILEREPAVAALEWRAAVDARDFFLICSGRHLDPDNRVPGAALRTIEAASLRHNHQNEQLFQFNDAFISLGARKSPGIAARAEEGPYSWGKDAHGTARPLSRISHNHDNHATIRACRSISESSSSIIGPNLAKASSLQQAFFPRPTTQEADTAQPSPAAPLLARKIREPTRSPKSGRYSSTFRALDTPGIIGAPTSFIATKRDVSPPLRTTTAIHHR